MLKTINFRYDKEMQPSQNYTKIYQNHVNLHLPKAVKKHCFQLLHRTGA